MTQQLQPKAPLSAETIELLRSPGTPTSELHAFFRAHADDPELDSWLLGELHPPTPHSQALIRLARQAHGYWDGFDGFQHLLVGMPMSIQALPASANWRSLRLELEGTLQSALLPLAANVAMAGHPVGADMLHDLGVTTLGHWSEALHQANDPAQDVPAAGEGPAVWVGLVSVRKNQREELEQLLFTTKSALSQTFLKISPRLEALAEEQGARLRFYPPTAYWNSLSFARLFHLRAILGPVKKAPGPWTATCRDMKLTVRSPAGVKLELPYAEELCSDFEPLFKDWANFHC